jgi:hypothetical protein
MNSSFASVGFQARIDLDEGKFAGDVSAVGLGHIDDAGPQDAQGLPRPSSGSDVSSNCTRPLERFSTVCAHSAPDRVI